jgi:hypothetical protein
MRLPAGLRAVVLPAAVVALTVILFACRAPSERGLIEEVRDQAGSLSEGGERGTGSDGIAETDRLFQAAKSNEFVVLPKHSKVAGRSVKVEDGVKKSILKFEAPLSPKELSWFYVEALVADGWGILRDDLTETIGWSAIFINFDDKERTLAVFAVVRQIQVMAAPSGLSDVRIIMIEQL